MCLSPFRALPLILYHSDCGRYCIYFTGTGSTLNAVYLVIRNLEMFDFSLFCVCFPCMFVVQPLTIFIKKKILGKTMIVKSNLEVLKSHLKILCSNAQVFISYLIPCNYYVHWFAFDVGCCDLL